MRSVDVDAPPATVPAAVAPQKRRLSRARQGALFAVPAALLALVFTVGPAIANTGLVFFEWSPLQPTFTFVGWDNVVAVFRSDLFHVSVSNTILYTALTVPLSIALGVAVAVALDKRRRSTPLRVVYFLPAASTLAAAALVWRFILDPQVGLVNQVLDWVGFSGQPWLLQSRTVMPAIVALGIWRQVGYMMVVYLAALAAIPRSLKEAAALDGLTGWPRFRHFTWPLLARATIFAVVIGTADGVQLFDQVQIMTEGGPANASSTLAYLVFKEGFQFYSFGRAAVVALVLVALILAVTAVQLRLGKRWNRWDHAA